MKNQTLAIIKPDALEAGLEGTICQSIAAHGLTIARKKRLRLTSAQTDMLYGEHLNKPYYNRLKKFMTSAESLVLLLQGDDAVAVWRGLMHNIRRNYAGDETRNCVHGADSPAAAAEEIKLFFPNRI